jgi:hypothetical protein
MAGYQLRDFTFTPTDDGGVEIVVRTNDSHGARIVRAIHLAEEELYEMLAAIGLSADEVEDELDGDQEPDDDEDEF